MKTTLQLTILIIALSTWSIAEARTWRVEKDGSGDFAVIQDAINAASSGDTLRVGPGSYEEYTWALNNGQWDVYSCAFVSQTELTFIGAGAGVTKIGLTSLDEHSAIDLNAFLMIGVGSLYISNLSIGFVDRGIVFDGETLDVDSCEIQGCITGAFTWGGTANRFENTTFRDNSHHGIYLASTTDNAIIYTCHFFDSGIGLYVSSCPQTLIENCTFRGGQSGLNIVEGTLATVRNCQFGERSGAAVWISSAFVDISNSYIATGLDGLVFERWGSLTGHGNVIEGCSTTTLRVGADFDQGIVDFHGNHILNGGGFSVTSTATNLNCPGEPCHIDLSGNYWGTDDPAQISAWIDDYNDYHPLDSTHRVIIDFAPFSPIEVPTEKKTLGGVKSLFR